MARGMQATTPTFSLILPETVDLTEAENVYVTFQQGSNILTKTGEELDVSAHQVDVYLSQHETLQFGQGVVDLQMNWTFSGGQRAATENAKIDWVANLLKKVVR